jgi:hypothetical protein
MIQKEFVRHVADTIHTGRTPGLAIGGSWITGEIDEFSDLDLVLVTAEKISGDRSRMLETAGSFGTLLNAFTGEHVGEPRLLICLFDNPLLHVDIKFVTLDELHSRVEDPFVYWERDNCLTEVIRSTEAHWPAFDFQWIEDRFWTWVHYAVLKIGRGEYFEALDFLSYLRMNVTAPLLQIKNGNLPRGLRKIEWNFSSEDIYRLVQTVPAYSVRDISSSLEQTISLYRDLRAGIFPASISLRLAAERKVMEYFDEVKKSFIDTESV